MVTISLNTQVAAPHASSQHALDWLNFFLAALLTGFGPFVAVHLTNRGWDPAHIGFVLSASGFAGLISQIPGGELIDITRARRAIVGAGAAAVALALLVVALRPEFIWVAVAVIVQGAAGSILGPGIAAISLGLVGHDALAERLGRNARFASVGGLVAAAVMGVIGYLLATEDIFLIAAALLAPLLFALGRIRASDIHFGRSCGVPDHHADDPPRVKRASLLKNSGLLIFALCLLLFQLGNASLLTQLGQALPHTEGRLSSLVVSALVVFPQIIVAALAPWAGRSAATFGRKPLLIIGLAAVPIRSTLFALTSDPVLLVVIQLLDGLSGATLGVLTALVVADLTAGTGRFNLAQGLVGAASGVGATLSTSVSGIIVEKFGYTAGLLGVTTVGLLSVVIVVSFMPETKPAAKPGGPDARSQSPPRVRSRPDDLVGGLARLVGGKVQALLARGRQH
jgi:MFS family permease